MRRRPGRPGSGGQADGGSWRAMVERRRVSLTLLDWRRRVAALYAEIRADPDVPAAHRHWREVRDDLFRHHPDSPLLPEDKEAFAGLPVAPYDPTLRFEARARHRRGPAAPRGADRHRRCRPVRAASAGSICAGSGDLDVWWLASYGGGLFVPVKDALAGAIDLWRGSLPARHRERRRPGRRRRRPSWSTSTSAYNPSCAYDPAWACPLAPPGNVLAQPVMAGELTGHPGHPSPPATPASAAPNKE